MKVACGANHTLLMTENMKIPKFRDEHKNNGPCEICQKFPIPNGMLLHPISKKAFCLDCVV